MELKEQVKGLQGVVGVYFKDLSTGETAGHLQDREFHPASIIKLPTVIAI